MLKEEIEFYVLEYKKSEEFKEKQLINKEQEKIRRKFVKKFTKEFIMKMDVDDYVQGKGEITKESFCKILEKELKELGQISGTSPADKKFGIYYSDDKKKYIYLPKKFGNCKNYQEFFEKLKIELKNLLVAGETDNIKQIVDNKISEIVKAKIYYVYNPEKALPIYSEKHLDFFIRNLEINIEKNGINTFEKRKKILEWKNNSFVFCKFSNLEFMNFLYSSYAFKQQINILKQEKTSKFIEPIIIKDREIICRTIQKNTKYKKKPNYEEINQKKMVIGLEAEEYVFQCEKKHNRKYSRKIKHVSKYSDSEGYDILSYDQNGNPKYIEVKTSRSGNLDKIDFYITYREKELLDTIPAFEIQYVCGLRTKKPKIIIINKNNIENIVFKPIVYKITGKIEDI